MKYLSLLIACIFSVVFITPQITYSQNKKKNRKFKVITVKGPEDLGKLKIEPSDEVAQAFLDELIETIDLGLPDQTYRFLFKKIKAKKRTGPFIAHKRKGVLLGFLRSPSADGVDIDLQEPGSSWEPTDTMAIVDTIFPPEEMRLNPRAISTATKGVCGPISVAHSLVRLGLRTAEQTFKDGFLEQNNFQQILQYQGNLTGIPLANYIKAHTDLGATICEQSEVIRAKSTRKLNTFNQELAQKMASTNPVWDCGLITKTQTSTGHYTLNHVEHVVEVTTKKTKRGHTAATIKTVNGLDQGNKKTTVPADPGTNTWTSVPRGKPNVRFAGSTHPKARQYKAGIPNPSHVQWVCCRKP